MNVITSTLAVIATYVFAGYVGLEFFAVPPGYATPIFFPAGIAVASVFLVGLSVAPAVFIGSFILNGIIGYKVTNGHVSVDTLNAAAVIAAASTAQAIFGAALFSKALGFYAITLISRINLWRLTILSPVVCLTSATLSVGSLWLMGVVATNQVGNNWLQWWAGDTFGLMLALPWMLFFLPTDRQIEFALRNKLPPV